MAWTSQLRQDPARDGAGAAAYAQAVRVRDSLSSDLASLRIQRETPPPRQRPATLWRVLAGAGVAAALIGGGVAVWPHVEARLFKTEVAVTRIALVSPIAASTTLSASGYVVPQVISKVASKIPGRVSKVLVREGDKVAKDQVLMELDSSDQVSQLAQVRSRLAAAQARALTARANLAEVQQQVAREKRLAEFGASARATMEDLQARQESLRAALNAADADIRVAQADEQAARVAMDQMTIRAPIGGTRRRFCARCAGSACSGMRALMLAGYTDPTGNRSALTCISATPRSCSQPVRPIAAGAPQNAWRPCARSNAATNRCCATTGCAARCLQARSLPGRDSPRWYVSRCKKVARPSYTMRFVDRSLSTTSRSMIKCCSSPMAIPRTIWPTSLTTT